TSTLKPFLPRPTTVRQAPLTAMLSPTATSPRPSRPASIERRSPPFDRSSRPILPTAAMMPLNMVRNFTWLVPALLAFAANAADSRYTEIQGSPDGIGKVYMGREIAKVMSYYGASWLERPERKEEERPDLVLAALDLKPGMKVADIGAGSGYYSSRMAERVGADGVVYAVDVQPEMVEILRLQMKQLHVTNVTPILGTETDPKLPAGAPHPALMGAAYHTLPSPPAMPPALPNSP